jgi:hypothetical protein
MHFPADILERFEIHEWRHASAILKHDYPGEWNDILAMLREFKLKRSWIIHGGGNKSELAKWVDTFLGTRGWVEKQFRTAVVVDDTRLESPTHYDRDLNNFRLLFDLRAISVGIIFTRCDELQSIFNELKRGTSYGNSTTHMSKLLPRIEGGSGAGCPIIAIGIRKGAYQEKE